MFRHGVPPVDYVDPWLQDFPERLARLGRGNRHVAYFYEKPDTSTFRYRVLNMIEALGHADPGVGASWFCIADLPHMAEILDRADAVVICRTRYAEGVAQLVAAARARGKRLAFDVDDLVFDDRFVHLLLETLDQQKREEDWNAWFGWVSRTGAVMRLCDRAIVTNPFLAARATSFSGLPAAVVPNFLNASQLALSRRLLEAKRRSGFARDGSIHLGYFSGTPTHNRDFAIIAETLAGLLAQDRRLMLRIVGFLEPTGPLAEFANRIETFPLQDFLNLQRLIAEVEVNLVPLQDNTFTNCKSELKVFEASAVGTISIASPSYTLRRAIRDGETGFLAPAHRWEEALLRGIEQVADYAPMAEAAAAAAFDVYVPERQGAAVLAAVFGDGEIDGAPQEPA